ncbi:hypothetical protein [Collimonas sp.]|jgi:hypothetical protein|uniref:hypothetical protein n=1 Tax=Collimonas sp. TaxID=1963772 RepID=UPI002B9B6A0E|nr:hypothetical protein [Collimonas sp.]HWW04217.1 hypothetical protein [Collimonas sp.]
MSHVRFAEAADIPALIELGRQMHVQSRYAWMVFNANSLWKYLEAVISNKSHCVIVASDDASPGASLTGGLLAHAQSLPFSSDFVAHIDYFYVAPKRRGTPVAMKMMIGLRRWADNREIAEILLSNGFGTEQVYSGKLLTKLGLKAVGGVHAMWMDRK